MTFFNFIIAMGVFAVLGVIGHVLRAVVNLYPDRLSDKPMMDVWVSDGYSLDDHLLQVEYDDYGFYRLDSRRNLMLTTSLTMLGGFFFLALDAAASNAISDLINTGLAMMWDVAKLRLAEIRMQLGLG
ncbi:MAG: hypothetical protein MUC58_07600 [Rhizobiaceae bacterium]|nr:hypothetical protein [Rhizobiaceae bacterium]